jgi:hypothetical protein
LSNAYEALFLERIEFVEEKEEEEETGNVKRRGI